MEDAVVTQSKDGAVVRIRVTPRASHTGVRAAGEWLAVSVRAPAEKGKATEEALRAVAEILGLARSRVVLAGGATSRDKRVLVPGGDASDLRKRLKSALRERD